MDKVFPAISANGQARTASIRGEPNICPICHTRMVPKFLTAVACGPRTDQNVEVAMQCTSSACERVFIGTYMYKAESGHFDFHHAHPSTPMPPNVGELVSKVSPSFCEIYQQAMASEAYGLHELTGIGLRKALEFLIKDFVCSRQPAICPQVKSKLLGACINDYIADETIKVTAKRAAWLGNDETHYMRKWEDKDIGDLKILIRLTMNAIENALLAEKYADEMPDGPGPKL